jgi:large subunit ribosomal protein L24
MRRKFNKIPKLHVKKGDTVRILSGDDRKNTGTILAVYPRKGTALVEGINMVTKHVKPNQRNPQGERITTEAPIRVCKLMVVDATGKPTRVGRRPAANGGWERYSKKSGQTL